MFKKHPVLSIVILIILVFLFGGFISKMIWSLGKWAIAIVLLIIAWNLAKKYLRDKKII